jgi:hypothetical protein
LNEFANARVDHGPLTAWDMGDGSASVGASASVETAAAGGASRAAMPEGASAMSLSTVGRAEWGCEAGAKKIAQVGRALELLPIPPFAFEEGDEDCSPRQVRESRDKARRPLRSTP